MFLVRYPIKEEKNYCDWCKEYRETIPGIFVDKTGRGEGWYCPGHQSYSRQMWYSQLDQIKDPEKRLKRPKMEDKHLVKIVTDARIESEVREDAWTDLVTSSAGGLLSIISVLEKAVSDAAVILFHYRSQSECFELADDLVKWWIRRVDNASEMWKSDGKQENEG